MYVVMVIYTNKISQVTREHVQFNSFNGTDFSCTFKGGLYSLMNRASAIFRFLLLFR